MAIEERYVQFSPQKGEKKSAAKPQIPAKTSDKIIFGIFLDGHIRPTAFQFSLFAEFYSAPFKYNGPAGDYITMDRALTCLHNPRLL